MEATASPTPKRRGPNSHRVKNMFAAVTADKQPLNDLIKKFNVSIHVARQSKRFDPTPEKGEIVLKTLTDESGGKTVYIWRVAPSA